MFSLGWKYELGMCTLHIGVSKSQETHQFLHGFCNSCRARRDYKVRIAQGYVSMDVSNIQINVSLASQMSQWELRRSPMRIELGTRPGKKCVCSFFLFYPWLVPGFQHNLKNQLNLYSLAGIFLCYFFLVGCVGVLQICSCSYQKFGEDSRGWIWIIFKGFESTSLPVAGLLSQWFINAFLGGGFKHFYFHPYLGKMIQFD